MSSRILVVPSVEWLSTTMTLNLNVVFCDKADFTASATVFALLYTGITTEASWLKSCSLKSGLT